MDILIYLGLLLFLIFIIYDEVLKTMQYCPVKIKGILVIIFSLAILRVAALLVLLISDRAELVYILRNMVFLNVVYIPLMMFICTYIFYRNIKFNVKWIYGVFITSLAFYFICIFRVPMEYYISLSYGYNVIFDNTLPYKIFMCVYGASFFIGMKGMKYQYSVKWGMALVEVASIISIISTVIAMRSTENVGYLLVGEVAFFVVMYMAVNTFKKRVA